MNKHIALFACFLLSHIAMSSEVAKEMHGFTATFNADGDAINSSESCWSVMTVPYEKGGIVVSYNLSFPFPPVVVITPITRATGLQQVTPLVIENTNTELTLVTTVTDIDGSMREAEDNEITLTILAMYPNDQVNTLNVTGATGLGSFDFGGS